MSRRCLFSLLGEVFFSGDQLGRWNGRSLRPVGGAGPCRAGRPMLLGVPSSGWWIGSCRHGFSPALWRSPRRAAWTAAALSHTALFSAAFCGPRFTAPLCDVLPIPIFISFTGACWRCCSRWRCAAGGGPPLRPATRISWQGCRSRDWRCCWRSSRRRIFSPAAPRCCRRWPVLMLALLTIVRRGAWRRD